jgi:aryl-alcohol dehydrogenase-like predicted oxidoreductase
MEYRSLGRAGLKVSEIALGTAMSFSLAEKGGAFECIKAAVESGINFIDSADVYPVYAHGEAERVIGAAIRELGLRRENLVISSKVFWPMSDDVNDRGLSRKHIMQSVESSLQRLGTSYLDIYFCHRHDRDTPVEEVVRAMSDLIQQGKVLYWGTGVWSPAQIEEAVTVARTLNAHPPRAEQPCYNMLARHIEAEARTAAATSAVRAPSPPDWHVGPGVLSTCEKHGIGATVFWPLAEGLLTGKYNDGVPAGSRAARGDLMRHELTAANLTRVRRLAELAQDIGITMAQLALAWILRRPEVSSVIVGATSPAHVEENARASGVALSARVLGEIQAILHEAPDNGSATA